MIGFYTENWRELQGGILEGFQEEATFELGCEGGWQRKGRAFQAVA